MRARISLLAALAACVCALGLLTASSSSAAPVVASPPARGWYIGVDGTPHLLPHIADIPGGHQDYGTLGYWFRGFTLDPVTYGVTAPATTTTATTTVTATPTTTAVTIVSSGEVAPVLSFDSSGDIVTSTTQASVLLDWTPAVASSDTSVKGYDILYRLSTSPTWTDYAGSPKTSANVSSFRVPSLDQGSQYFFEVRAVYANKGYGPLSNQVSEITAS